MTQRLGLSTSLLLTVPPLMWAGNAVVGRLVRDDIPPFTLNFLRWVLAFAILLPLAAWVLRRSGGMWSHWRRFAVLGLFGVGLYNTLQYLALQTSTALNVTLVASSMPLWMLLLGTLFFDTRVSRQQLVGAGLSMSGVVVVLTRGDWTELLGLRLVVGDLFMLAATFCWALYSWLLSRRAEPDAIRNDWAAFLLAQVTLGLVWSGMFTAGEWALTDAHLHWSPMLLAALAFVAVGPAVLAYRCWGLGVQRAGPAVAGFFTNLTPLFAAVMATAFLGELPQIYHGVAFALILAGIYASSRQ
ncbi:MAG: DMT family transporter [Rhodoferax sp.]|nr:DMT family transporter [Rhodoferax sp.]